VPESRFTQQLDCAFEHRAFELFVGGLYATGRQQPCHRCAGFIRKIVSGDVVEFEGHEAFQVPAPLVERLIGNREHQVAGQVVESRLACRRQCGGRFVGVVNASQGLQVNWMERLSTDAQAIHAGGPKGSQFFESAALEASGVGFQRYLAIGERPKFIVYRFYDSRDRLRGKQRGRTSTEKDRSNFAGGPVVGVRGRCRYFSQQRIDVARFGELPNCIGVEVAIRTFLKAIREVDVDREAQIRRIAAICSVLRQWYLRKTAETTPRICRSRLRT